MSKPNFEFFTTEARELVHLAKIEASKLQHTWIEPEHLLYAIVSQGDDTIAAQALLKLGVRLEQVSIELQKFSREETEYTGISVPTGTFLDVLRCAEKAANSVLHDRVYIDDLFAGIFYQRLNNAVRLLKDLGVSSTNIREAFWRVCRERQYPIFYSRSITFGGQSIDELTHKYESLKRSGPLDVKGFELIVHYRSEH